MLLTLNFYKINISKRSITCINETLHGLFNYNAGEALIRDASNNIIKTKDFFPIST